MIILLSVLTELTSVKVVCERAKRMYSLFHYLLKTRLRVQLDIELLATATKGQQVAQPHHAVRYNPGTGNRDTNFVLA